MSTSGSPASKSIHEQIVDVQRAIAGPHAGHRPVHAKGIVCAGTFRASAEARRVSRAVHLQGEPHLAVIRFSNASGEPDVHDGLRNVRALSVKFQLPGGGSADILANTIEGFPARTPEEFLAFMQAQLPDPGSGKAAPDRVAGYLESHPASKAFVERLSKKPVPASYAQASYHGVHAFRFSAADGSSRFGRYSWMPDAGEAYLSPDEAVNQSRNFLREELEGRLLGGPVFFGLALQLALESDPTDDATALWPAVRPVVALGRLEITSISPTSAADERRLVFDPANRTNGIDLSPDPILLARSAAYSISFDRRNKGVGSGKGEAKSREPILYVPSAKH